MHCVVTRHQLSNTYCMASQTRRTHSDLVHTACALYHFPFCLAIFKVRAYLVCSVNLLQPPLEAAHPPCSVKQWCSVPLRSKLLPECEQSFTVCGQLHCSLFVGTQVCCNELWQAYSFQQAACYTCRHFVPCNCQQGGTPPQYVTSCC
jgi:hypothetical protein